MVNGFRGEDLRLTMSKLGRIGVRSLPLGDQAFQLLSKLYANGVSGLVGPETRGHLGHVLERHGQLQRRQVALFRPEVKGSTTFASET